MRAERFAQSLQLRAGLTINGRFQASSELEITHLHFGARDFLTRRHHMNATSPHVHGLSFFVALVLGNRPSDANAATRFGILHSFDRSLPSQSLFRLSVV